MASESKAIYQFFTRREIGNGNISFDDLLLEAIEKVIGKSGSDRDRYFDANHKRIWNYILKQQDEEFSKKGILPVFDIVSSVTRTISCCVSNKFAITAEKKYYLLKSRSYILNEIDLLSHREYEALSVLICKSLGANNLLLTAAGNECGIDFIATFKFSEKAHYLFGINGPIRIIGQCKKYGAPIQVDKVKEFNATLFDVFHLTEKVRKVLPFWFHQSSGPIIGWIVSHNGFQQGAKDRAKDFGLILSDSRDLGEILASSKKFWCNKPYLSRHKELKNEIKAIL